jgi:hypothetical protein
MGAVGEVEQAASKTLASVINVADIKRYGIKTPWFLVQPS